MWWEQQKMTEIANNVPAGLSDSLTGVTTASYADALLWSCLGFMFKTIIIKNTDSAKTMKYKVWSIAHKGGLEHAEVTETTLGTGAQAKHNFEHADAALRVEVKDGTGHATYQLDYTGNRN
jgi:hypothetical protein